MQWLVDHLARVKHKVLSRKIGELHGLYAISFADRAACMVKLVVHYSRIGIWAFGDQHIFFFSLFSRKSRMDRASKVIGRKKAQITRSHAKKATRKRLCAANLFKQFLRLMKIRNKKK